MVYGNRTVLTPEIRGEAQMVKAVFGMIGNVYLDIVTEKMSRVKGNVHILTLVGDTDSINSWVKTCPTGIKEIQS